MWTDLFARINREHMLRQDQRAIAASRREAARLCAVGLVVIVGLLYSPQAHAHTSLPGYLALQESSPGSFDLVWKVPTAEGPPPAIYPVFSANCTISSPLVSEQAPGAIIERGRIDCGRGGPPGAA